MSILLVSLCAPAAAAVMVPIPLESVALLPGSHQYRSEQTNLEYLTMLSPDSLLFNFRTTAGLDPSAFSPDLPYNASGSWDGPDSQHRGSFAGHWLSASALAWASTKNATLQSKMSYMVKELRRCQLQLSRADRGQGHGGHPGYVMAMPESIFDSLEYEPDFYNSTHWHPYYNMHKLLAGMLDQFTHGKDPLALTVATDLGSYLYSRIQKFNATVGREGWQRILEAEWGGMNEALYNLFAITGDERHAEVGDWFSKEKFTTPLLAGIDPLTGLHANTHIPTVVGAARRYELGGGDEWRRMTGFFFDTLNATRTFATAGSNYKEHWQGPMALGGVLSPENQETCTQYNMLKIARKRFEWTASPRFIDWYERALVNGILGTQKTSTPGVMIYMTPLGVGVSKAVSKHGWGKPYNSFWCCYGTGMESNAKFADTIYMLRPTTAAASAAEGLDAATDTNTLHVLQYTSSTVQWNVSSKCMITVVQRSLFPVGDSTDLAITNVDCSGDPLAAAAATISVRVPGWATAGAATITVSNCSSSEPVTHQVTPGTFFDVGADGAGSGGGKQPWTPGCIVKASFKQTLYLEHIQDNTTEYKSWNAILFGNTVLVGLVSGAATNSNAIAGVDPRYPEKWIKRLDAGGNASSSSGPSNILLCNQESA